MSATPILGYLYIRGAAQPIRLLLEYVGAPYEDKMYEMGPGFEKPEWVKEKFTLGLPFPNLPYYIHGDVKITGSVTIARYIANKHNLAGRTEEEQLQVDMLQQVAYDIMWSGIVKIFQTDPSIMEEKKSEFINGPLKIHLDNFSKYLGNKKFFTGDNVTYVDFYLYELLFKLSTFAEELFNKYPVFKTFLHSVETLPAIAKYMKSEKYVKYFANASH